MPEIVRMIWKLLVVAGTVYAGVSLVVFLFQGSLVYFPARNLTATPAALQLDYEDVLFNASDGVRLHGWYVPAANPGPTLLFFHGNAGNISHRLESIQIFHTLGLNTFIFDYRGYGNSEGAPSEEGTYADARAAWEYLRTVRGTPAQAIVIFGRSLGAGPGTWLASQVEPRALIVESAFTSVPDMAATIYPFLPVRLLARIRYENRTRIARVNAPVLVVHSRDDELVPFSHGEQLFQAASEPKEMLVIRGGHNDGFFVSGGHYVNGLASFLAALPPLAATPPALEPTPETTDSHLH